MTRIGNHAFANRAGLRLSREAGSAATGTGGVTGIGDWQFDLRPTGKRDTDPV